MFVSDYIATYHIYSHSLYRILNICFRCLMLACHMIYFYTYYHHIPQHFQSYYMVIYYHSLSQVTCTSPPRNFWMNEDTHHNLSHFYMAQVCILSDHNPYTLSLPKCDFFHNPSRNLVSNSPWIYFNPLTDFSC